MLTRQQSYLTVTLPDGKNGELRQLEAKLNPSQIEIQEQIHKTQAVLVTWYKGSNGSDNGNAFKTFGKFWHENSRKRISVNDRGLELDIALYVPGEVVENSKGMLFLKIKPRREIMGEDGDVLREHIDFVRNQIRRMDNALRETSESYGRLSLK